MRVPRGSSGRLLKEIPESPSTELDAAAAAAAGSTDVDGVQLIDTSSMAVTALIVLLALFLVGFFALYARRFFSGIHGGDFPHQRRRQPPSRSYAARYGGRISFPAACGLEPAAVKALPVLRYVGGGGGGVKEGCVVCLTEFEEEGEAVKLLPGCGHVFHPQCIDAWLVAKGSCPICRCSDVFGRSGSEGRLRDGAEEVRLGLFEVDGGDDQEESGEQEAEAVVVEVRVEAEAKERLGRRSSSCTWREEGGGNVTPTPLRRTCSL